MLDPLVQKEVIGTDRVETARLGIATLRRSLENLPAAVSDLEDPQARMRAVYDLTLALQSRMLTSVASVPGGLIENQAPGGMVGPTYSPTSAADQLAAASFVMGEGIDSFEPYLDRDLIEGFRPFGASDTIEAAVTDLVDEVLDTPRLRAIADAADRDPDGSPSVEAYFGAITEALLADADDPDALPRLRKVALVRYLSTLQAIVDPGMPANDDSRDAMVSASHDPALARFLNAGLDDTDVGDAAQAGIDGLTRLFGN